MKAELKNLIDKANKLNDEMYDALVRLIKQQGVVDYNGIPASIVRTDYREQKVPKDLIYAILMEGDDAENEEYNVLAVAVFGEDMLAVLVDMGEETIVDVSSNELAHLDTWYTIKGGYVLQNATLYSICECISQYLPV